MVKCFGVGIVGTIVSYSSKYWCTMVKMFGIGIIGDLTKVTAANAGVVAW